MGYFHFCHSMFIVSGGEKPQTLLCSWQADETPDGKC